MASDIFVQLDTIDGESIDSGHSKWIEVIDVEHGSSQNVSISRANDVSGRGQFAPVTFTHLLDKATPKIQQYCMAGQKIAKAEMHVCRAIGGKQQIVYDLKMENVKIAKAIIKTIPVDGEGTDARQVVEVVELVAGKLTWKVQPVKADNTLDGAVEASFNQVTNS